MAGLTACGLKDAQQADQQKIDRLMAERKSEVTSCYDEALKRHPSLEDGSLTVRSQQHIDGSLHSTQMIRGFSGSNEIFDCVAEKVNSWKTEPPQTWGPVDLTFEFKNHQRATLALNKDFGTLMKEHRGQIGECFKRELSRNPNLSGGELKFKFLRTKDGRVLNLQQVSNFKGGQPVFECVARILSGFKLGPTPDDSAMMWAQNFNRDDSLAEQPRSSTTGN